jgi:uncharacterized damage-inducible protein DinB
MVVMATTRRADMFTADGKPSDDDPREHGPTLGDERATLVESLRCQRLTLELKCADLDAEAMARRSVEPSTMSLLGLVRHLAQVERGWFREVLQEQGRLPPLYEKTAEWPDPDFDGAVADPAVVAEAWDNWRREVRAADAWMETLPENGLGGTVPRRRGQKPIRDVLVHMVEEYARHVGHADLLRECIDGRVGQ